MNQSTHGDTKHDVQVKTQTYSILHVTRSSTKTLLTKQKRFVLVKQGRIPAQYEQSVCGMPSDETNLMEYGED